MTETLVLRNHDGIDPQLHVWGWDVAGYLFLGGLVAGLLFFIGVRHEARIYNDRLYVGDIGLHQVYEFDLDGKILATIGERGQKPGQFDCPHSIYVDKQGNMFVAEVTAARIQKLVPRR